MKLAQQPALVCPADNTTSSASSEVPPPAVIIKRREPLAKVLRGQILSEPLHHRHCPRDLVVIMSDVNSEEIDRASRLFRNTAVDQARRWTAARHNDREVLASLIKET